MTKFPVLVGIGLLVFLMSCSGSGESMTAGTVEDSLGLDRSPLSKAADMFSAAEPHEVVVEREVVKEVAVEAAMKQLAGRSGAAGAVGPAGAASNGGEPLLQVAQRKVISTASVSLEVEDVQEAMDRVRAIAEGVSGFVEHLTSGGGPLRQRATITIRVPQTEFSGVLLQIEGLGSVQDTTQGSEDVSERFIDLKARLDSALREEKSLLALLEKASAVSEVLAIERELARVRSEIERSQGQLNFLERRVALATITVTLSLPHDLFPEPPSADISVEAANVKDSVEAAKQLAVSMNGAIDRVVTTVRGDSTRSTLSVRVFPADFQQMMDLLESQGRVRHKQIEEGALATEASFSTSIRPEAKIDVVFFDDRENLALYWMIGSVSVVVGLLLVGGVAYRLGSRRQRVEPRPIVREVSEGGAEG